MHIDRDNRKLIVRAFQEDAPRGDITARFFSDKKTLATAKIISKQTGVIAGLSVAISCFQYISKKIEVIQYVKDGQTVNKGEILLELSGPLEKILLAERTALNFLQHLSGVATATASLVRLLQGTSCKLLDTRKTLPGYRQLEKYAVLCGGGTNHRHSLSDMILIKENHLRPLTLEQLQKNILLARQKTKAKIEIEAENLEQVKEFLKLPIDIIMLDNMSLPQLRKAVALRKKTNPSIQLEASGNVSARTIKAIAKTGVDYISCGAITHSAEAFDVSLLVDAS
jgi:nicotinate-nucleotide pyrophosphorylase (carboxylating)